MIYSLESTALKGMWISICKGLHEETFTSTP